MGNGMNKYEDFVDELQKDLEIPANVMEKFSNTLDSLPDRSGQHGKGKRKMHKWMTSVAAATVLLVGGTGFCLANPVLAAKIPVIGKIFEQVQDNVTFSGDFDKAQSLSTDTKESDAGAEDQDSIGQQLGKEYTVSDQGVTVRASEVYCDGYSIYLTAEINFDQGGLNNAASYYTSGDKTAGHLYAYGTWSTEDGAQSGETVNGGFEGKAVDDNTFVGMIKVDLSEVLENDDILKLNFYTIGFDDMNDRESESNDMSHRFDGAWNLAIPFSVDSEYTQMIQVDQIMDNGAGIEKVFISPYQVVAFEKKPETTYTEEERQKMYQEYVAGLKELQKEGEDVKIPPIEEVSFASDDFAFYASAYTQDDQALQYANSDVLDRQVFSTNGKEISKLHVFIMKEDTDLEAWKGDDINAAREAADLEFEVDVDPQKTAQKPQDTIGEQLGTKYAVSDQGVTATASEVYSDGYSVYLTAKITVEEGGLLNAAPYQAEDATQRASFYTRGTWKTGSDGQSGELSNGRFEGRVVDDHTFIGMLKVDMGSVIKGKNVLNLNLSLLGYDDVKMLTDDIGHKFEGTWGFEIPFPVDNEQTKMIQVDQTMEDGCGIEKVFVSPYQVVAFEKTPEPVPYTEEEIKQEYENGREKMKEVGEDLSLEEFKEEYKETLVHERPLGMTAVFTQDGTPLDGYGGEVTGQQAYSSYGKEISKLHFFLKKFEMNDEDTTLLEATSLEEAREAVYDLEIEVDVK